MLEVLVARAPLGFDKARLWLLGHRRRLARVEGIHRQGARFALVEALLAVGALRCATIGHDNRIDDAEHARTRHRRMHFDIYNPRFVEANEDRAHRHRLECGHFMVTEAQPAGD